MDSALDSVQAGLDGLLDRARTSRTKAKTDSEAVFFDSKIGGLKEAYELVRILKNGGDPSTLIKSGKNARFMRKAV